MVSGWMKPIIMKQFRLLFLNPNDNRNYPKDPDQNFTYHSS